jgi:importin-5
MMTLLPPLLSVLVPILEEKNSENLTYALTTLISVAGAHPKMFKDLFSQLVQFAISVIKENSLDDSARQAALELLVTFAEGAPAMCRKDPNYAMATVEQILSLMCDHDGDPIALDEWRKTDDVLPNIFSMLTIVGF